MQVSLLYSNHKESDQFLVTRRTLFQNPLYGFGQKSSRYRLSIFTFPRCWDHGLDLPEWFSFSSAEIAIGEKRRVFWRRLMIVT
jgi:hypothetical protein